MNIKDHQVVCVKELFCYILTQTSLAQLLQWLKLAISSTFLGAHKSDFAL